MIAALSSVGGKRVKGGASCIYIVSNPSFFCMKPHREVSEVRVVLIDLCVFDSMCTRTVRCTARPIGWRRFTSRGKGVWDRSWLNTRSNSSRDSWRAIDHGYRARRAAAFTNRTPAKRDEARSHFRVMPLGINTTPL